MDDLIFELKSAGYRVERWADVPDILDVTGNGFSGLLFCLKNGYAALVAYECYPFFSSDALDALYMAAEGYFGTHQP